MFKNKFLLLVISFLIISLPARDVLANEEQSIQDENQIQNSEQEVEDLSSTKRVIAHQDLQNTELSLNELRAIFSLRARKWPDGTPITVFVLRDEHEAHRQFLLKTLKMLPHQLRRQWDRYIYSGIGQGPTVVESPEEMLSRVKSTPGGIGYIEGGMSDGSVHILTIR
jgi:ABC-type phosphate transport system substrate-binding protein